MATNYSPKIVTDGLLHYYDVGNKKSFDNLVSGNLYNLVNKSQFMDCSLNEYTEFPSKLNMKGGVITISDSQLFDIDGITFVCWGNFNTIPYSLFSGTTHGATPFTLEVDGGGQYVYTNDTFIQSLNVYDNTNLVIGVSNDTNYHMVQAEIIKISSENTFSFGIWDGSMSVVMIYNKILTAEESLQNYNALKGRYIPYNV